MIIGLDTGGTHVDAVIIENGQIIDTAKTPTNRDNLFASIWEALTLLLKNKNFADIEHINLSTTITTNAVVEGKSKPVAMFIEGGPGIDPTAFKCGDYSVFLEGSIDHRGLEIRPLNQQLIHQELNNIKSRNIKGAAVVGKFSTRNPSHELQVKNILTKQGFSPVTMGHGLSGKLNFPRRIFTAYLNSAVYSYFNEFASAVKSALHQKGITAPVYILKADGGTITIDEATQFPVQTILSGPAASVMGSLACLELENDTLLLDIGGTTTDISFLAEGVPLFVPDGISIANYPTLVRAIYSTSLGLGGDSAVEISSRGEISIGPERHGKPLALGGPSPTPSDAMIVLGKLNFGNRDQALKGMQVIGDKLKISPLEAATKIYHNFGQIIKDKVAELLEEINSQPVYTIHELLYGKILEPQEIVVIGGPAQAAAPLLEEHFSLPCKVPTAYHIANAIGAALTRRTFEINLLADTQQQILTVPELSVYQKISGNFTLESGKKKALKLLKEQLRELGSTSCLHEGEILEAQSFNMVRGFSTVGKNIRVRAQIKPGLIGKIGGDK